MKNVKSYIILILIVATSCSVKVDLTDLIDIKDAQKNYIPKNLLAENEGLLGQFLFVKGEDFFLDSLSFFFNEERAYGSLKNKDTLLIKVPRTLKQVQSNFNIFLGTKDSLIYSSKFILKKPKITSYSKNKVTFGESFWIRGENFDTDYKYINIYLNDKDIGYSSLFLDSVKATIPNNIQQKELTIRIEAQLQQVSKSNELELKQPIINRINSEVFIGTSGNILSGKYLNPDSRYSKIIINDEIEARIYYTNGPESIDFIMPYGPYKDFKIYSITYETAGMLVRKEVTTKIISNHILFSKNFPLSTTKNKFIFNNELYVIAPERTSNNTPAVNYLWRFNLDNREWVKDDRIQIPAYSLTLTEINDGILYLYRDVKTDGLFKIDLNTYVVKNIPNIPDYKNRSGPVLFKKNNYLYLGKGKNQSNGRFHEDLFRLDLNSGKWEAINTDNKKFYQNKTFTENGSTYLLTYTLGSSINFSLHKFNLTNSSFEKINYYDYEGINFIYINNKYFRISTNSSTQIKSIYDFDDIAKPKFSFKLNSFVNNTDYFSFNNEIYFTGSENNSPNSSLGLYKLSEEITNQFFN